MMYRVDRTARSRPQHPIANLWVIAGAFIVACIMLAITFSILFWTRASSDPAAPSTAILVIQPAVSATPTVQEQSSQTPNALEATPGILSLGEVQVGAFVQVTGTGGDGLRLRDQPGLSGGVLLVASEAEVFEVDEGPVEMDGYTWWHLRGPFDPSREGWGVASFLAVVQNP